MARRSDAPVAMSLSRVATLSPAQLDTFRRKVAPMVIRLRKKAAKHDLDLISYVIEVLEAQIEASPEFSGANGAHRVEHPL